MMMIMICVAYAFLCVGYGNIAPKTSWGQIITIPYAVVGIPLTMLTIAHLGGFMATVFRFLYRNVFCGICCTLCRRRRGAYNATELSESAAVDTVTPAARMESREMVRRTAMERVRDSYRVMVQWRRGISNALYTEDNLLVQVPLCVSLLLIVGYISLGALMFGLWEPDWDPVVAFYFSFITLSTIGFGDYVPGTRLGAFASQEKKILCALYLAWGLALLAMCFDLMQEEARKMFRHCGRRLGLT